MQNATAKVRSAPTVAGQRAARRVYVRETRRGDCRRQVLSGNQICRRGMRMQAFGTDDSSEPVRKDINSVGNGFDVNARVKDRSLLLPFPDNIPNYESRNEMNENTIVGYNGAGAAAPSGGQDVANPTKQPPPDLPSTLLNKRLVFLGKPLIPSVSELIVAELLYLAYMDRKKEIQMYINSTGTTRADGEVVGFETEGTMIYDVMNYIRPEVWTVNTGVCAGMAAMLLAAGAKGKRYMTPNSTTLLQQPRTPQTGQLQAIELDIRFREMEAQQENYYKILSKCTGNSIEKLKYDLIHPLYMSGVDAVEYGVVDRIIAVDKKMLDRLIEEEKVKRKEKEMELANSPASPLDKYKQLK